MLSSKWLQRKRHDGRGEAMAAVYPVRGRNGGGDGLLSCGLFRVPLGRR
jgi:hypothetical protein